MLLCCKYTFITTTTQNTSKCFMPAIATHASNCHPCLKIMKPENTLTKYIFFFGRVFAYLITHRARERVRMSQKKKERGTKNRKKLDKKRTIFDVSKKREREWEIHLNNTNRINICPSNFLSFISNNIEEYTHTHSFIYSHPIQVNTFLQQIILQMSHHNLYKTRKLKKNDLLNLSLGEKTTSFS